MFHLPIPSHASDNIPEPRIHAGGNPRVVGELALPVAGLVTDIPATEAAAAMDELHALLRTQGVRVTAPFMIESFLALSVIPSLKLTDRGLVDVNAFALVDFAASSPVPSR